MQKASPRILKTVVLVKDLDIDYMPIDDIIARLQRVKEEHGDKFSSIILEADTRHGYYDETWNEYHIVGHVMETQEEADERQRKTTNRLRKSRKTR